MNREIEFRGFDGTKWYYGDLEYNRKTDVARIHTYKEDGSYCRQYTVDPDTVGEFTGMRDKRGNKVFEGDIVRYYRVDSRCINPDCDLFNHIYEQFLKQIEGAVSYECGMFACEDNTPLVWCGCYDLETLRDQLGATEDDGWCDYDGNIIDESKLGIEVVGNIYDTK